MSTLCGKKTSCIVYTRLILANACVRLYQELWRMFGEWLCGNAPLYLLYVCLYCRADELLGWTTVRMIWINWLQKDLYTRFTIVFTIVNVFVYYVGTQCIFFVPILLKTQMKRLRWSGCTGQHDLCLSKGTRNVCTNGWDVPTVHKWVNMCTPCGYSSLQRSSPKGVGVLNSRF